MRPPEVPSCSHGIGSLLCKAFLPLTPAFPPCREGNMKICYLSISYMVDP